MAVPAQYWVESVQQLVLQDITDFSIPLSQKERVVRIGGWGGESVLFGDRC